ncbi:MAG: helix-turn-helix domain-containing protein [Candidatus Heimdallarchaeota archaeon]|nr:helix-turn-helix domain-containing protein [Candidatus Heimdallarchaeota archaeon]MDH5644760.1 helix-turn-helix domain-containing protein [Candidatus Heimdallarchaeota archaeon]
MSPSYVEDRISALNHPMRVSLYDLIRKGVKSAPEMAKILGEDRINLYHHLSQLEKAGLISSSYDRDRIKVYELISLESPEVDLFSIQNKNEGNELIQTESKVILNPQNLKLQKKFRKKIKEILEIENIKLSDDMDIMQVQIMFQSKKSQEIKNENLEKLISESSANS